MKNEQAMSPEQLSQVVREIRAELNMAQFAITALTALHPEPGLVKICISQLYEEHVSSVLASTAKDERFLDMEAAKSSLFALLEYAEGLQQTFAHLRQGKERD